MTDLARSVRPVATILSSCAQGHDSPVWPVSNPSSGGAPPAANRATYCPVVVDDFVTVTKMAVLPTSGTGVNIDVGIYSETGKRLVSAGSTPQGLAGAVQVIDIADLVLDPGIYFLAFVPDGTGTSWQRHASAGSGYIQCCGVQQQDSALPLPATATFANPSSSFVPLIQAFCMSGIV